MPFDIPETVIWEQGCFVEHPHQKKNLSITCTDHIFLVDGSVCHLATTKTSVAGYWVEGHPLGFVVPYQTVTTWVQLNGLLPRQVLHLAEDHLEDYLKLAADLEA